MAAKLLQTRRMGGEFLAITHAELVEPLGNMIEPAANLVARCQLARPFIQVGTLARDPARPDVVDQQAVAIPRLERRDA